MMIGEGDVTAACEGERRVAVGEDDEEQAARVTPRPSIARSPIDERIFVSCIVRANCRAVSGNNPVLQSNPDPARGGEASEL